MGIINYLFSDWPDLEEVIEEVEDDAQASAINNVAREDNEHAKASDPLAKPASVTIVNMLTVNAVAANHVTTASPVPIRPSLLSKQLGLKVVYPGTGKDGQGKATVDVVAVHGIGADPDYTWHTAGVNWLEHSEMLPAAIPNARIMRFGYSSRYIGNEADEPIKQELSTVAAGLLQALRSKREADPKRPLVFIGHCFGGLVIQKAITTARAYDTRWPDIVSSTTGIIFLGTPHRGTGDLTSKGLILRAIASDPSLKIDDTVLRALEAGNDHLVDVLNEFLYLCNKPEVAMSICCFYELQTTPVGMIIGDKKLKEFVVDRTSGHLEGHPNYGLPLDHFRLNKYTGPEDGNYIAVSDEIKIIVQEANGKVRKRLQSALGSHLTPKSFVPFERDGKFIGREDILSKIHDLHEGKTRVALSGIGGVGKSQIAIEYTYRFREANPNAWVFWVYTGSAERFDHTYRDIAKKLELPGVDDPDVDVLGLVTAWLNNEQNNGSWLMILDNFDDTHVLFNATSHVAVKKKIQHGRSSSGTATFEAMPRILAKYIPQTDRGRILITTRDRFAAFKLVGDHGRIVDIPTMNELEALELLHSKLPEHKGNDPDCKELVKEMDYLPLAVTQASAYIGVNAQMTVSKYLFMFRKDSSKQARLLERDSGDLRRDLDVPNAVIKTWELSFSQIEGRKPGAIELLSLLSFLDCQGTPEFLLLDEEDDELDLQDNIGMLTAYSLIFVAKGGLAYGMHRLVQIATRRWLETHDKMNVWKFEALKKVAKLFPSGNFETWKECQMALPQVKIVTDYKNISNEAEIYRANLLYKTSHYYEEQALWGSALEGFEEALKVRELVLGAEHPDTLTVVHSLGWAFHSMSKKQTAEELTRRALVARQAALGKQHPDTLNTLNNLAFMIDDEDMAKEALDGRRQSLGEHAETAESLHNVSIILLNKGKIDEALQLNTEALALMEKLYGQEHPTTLTALFIRSGILVDIGDNDGAEEVALRCLEIREAKLGPTHIDSIVSLEDCASVYNAKRDFVKAEDFIRRAIKLYEEHPEKGPSHSNTLLSLSFLGRYLSQQKKFDEAEEIFRLALDRVIAKFGPEHDETLLCQGDLGLMYLRQKKPDQAMTILEPLMKAGRGMKIRNQSVLDITYTIAEKFYRQNKLEEDLVLRKALVDGHTHVAGPMDPATLNAMNGLGMALQRAGHDTEAEEVHLKTWTSRVEVLGPENRQTLSSSRKLVMLLKKRGAKDEAEEQLRREREVSSTTPEQTIVRYESLHCIAREKHRRMKLDDAETLVREVLKWRRENLKSEDLTTLQSVHLLGMTLEDMETPEADAEAELCYREAYEKRLNLIGAEDDRTVAALRGLVCVLGYQKKDAEMTELKKLLPKRKKKKKKKDTGTEKTNTGGNVENEGGKETETTEEAKESEDSEGSEDSDGTDETDSEMEVNDEENEAKKEETEAKEDESAAKKAQSEVNEDGNEAINDEEEAKKDDNEPTDAR